MSGDVALSAIRDCLLAGMPSPLATCGPDGTPHLNFISCVRYLDSERVATSRQSFNPGLAHLDATAAETGSGTSFRLRGMDVHSVLRCALVPRLMPPWPAMQVIGTAASRGA